jgi:hypothetical protein
MIVESLTRKCQLTLQWELTMKSWVLLEVRSGLEAIHCKLEMKYSILDLSSYREHKKMA